MTATITAALATLASWALGWDPWVTASAAVMVACVLIGERGWE